MVSLTFMSLVAYFIQHMPHNIITKSLYHPLGLGFVNITYVTNHYVMKAYVTD